MGKTGGAPLYFDSITSIASRLQDRTLSAIDLTEAMLERIAGEGKKYRPYATVMAETARKQAAAAQAELDRGFRRGPLHGVPIALKDLIYTVDAPTSNGMGFKRDWRAPYNATVVERLEGAGAVVLGKVKMSEGAYTTHHPTVEPPLNPWNPLYWTGSSSSGSAVATAAGLSFAALATDTGGSVRFPSACNNLSGIKPTRGRVSAFGVYPFCPSLDHVGSIARSVTDAALVLQAIAGRDDRDPTAVDAPVPDYLEEGKRGLDTFTIGYDEAVLGLVDAEVAESLRRAMGVFAANGVKFVKVTLPDFTSAARLWPLFCATETANVHASDYDAHPEAFGAEFARLIERGRKIPGTVIADAWLDRLAFTARMKALLDGIDGLLLPVMTITVPTDAELNAFGGDDDDVLVRMIRFTAPIDISGQPAVVLPCGFSSDGLPLSLQIVGPDMAEGALIAAGLGFQRRTDWHLRHPGA